MKNLTSFLFIIFMAMFWIFRTIVALLFNLGIEFIIVPYDLTFEIVLLFLTLISMVLVIKRSVLGGIIYAIGYELYFGTIIISFIPRLQYALSLNEYINIIINLFGIILPILVLADLLLDRSRKINPIDKKTDWFYKNKAYDREFDERADRNEYKF